MPGLTWHPLNGNTHGPKTEFYSRMGRKSTPRFGRRIYVDIIDNRPSATAHEPFLPSALPSSVRQGLTKEARTGTLQPSLRDDPTTTPWKATAAAKGDVSPRGVVWRVEKARGQMRW